MKSASLSLHNISYQKYAKFLGIVLLVGFFGCSTTNTRITEHKEAFSNLPPETQMKVQNGEIEKGYTEDMVYMAKGNPSEKKTLHRGGKVVSVWKYGASRPMSVRDGVPNSSNSLSGSFGYPEFSPSGPHHPAPYQNAPPLEVEFENGRVSTWH